MLISACLPQIVLISLLVHPNQAIAIDRGLNHTVPRVEASADATRCGFNGNSDVLGIGIRIGYYTQALSVWFANYFVLSETKALRSINLLFLVALFIGLVWQVHAPQQTYAVEIFLLLRLLFATWYVGVLDRSKFSKKQWRKSLTRIIIREASLLGLLAYSVWFAWVGLDHLKETPCGTFILFVTKVNLYGLYRSAFKALSISALCFATLKQMSTASLIYQRWRPSVVRGPDYFDRLRQSLAKDACNTDIGEITTVHVGQPSVMNSITPKPSEPDPSVLEAAIRTPLPQSPKCSPKSSPGTLAPTKNPNLQCAASPQTPQNLPSLIELVAAERYLQSIIEVDVSKHSLWCYEIKWIPLKVFLPTIHSPRSLYRRLCSLCGSRPFRFSITIPLFRHIRSLCRFPLYSYLIMIEMALQSPYHKQVTSTTLLTTLAFHKARLPPHKPTPHFVLHACASLCMCIGLILGIELGMHWNHITGIGNIGAVGQLIPAIIGVGGLLRVFWIFWHREGGSREEEGDGIEKDLRQCAELYEKLKKSTSLPGGRAADNTHIIAV